MALKMCVEVEQFTRRPGDTNPRTTVVLLPVVYSPAWTKAEWVVAEHPEGDYAVVSVSAKGIAAKPKDSRIDCSYYLLSEAIAECDRLNHTQP
jgi:hypothetical protein